MNNSTRSTEKNIISDKIPVWGWVLLMAMLGILWKIIWLANQAFPFNSDEAITGLMARHILQGERPVFFYGQAYMGSLDAFLVAGLFRLLGDSILSIRILQMILYTCTIISTAALGWKLTHRRDVTVISSLLMAIPVVNVTLYTTVSLGGYGEALVLSNAACLCALSMDVDKKGEMPIHRLIILSILLGLITGLGFWSFGLSLVATVPACLYGFLTILKARKKNNWIFPIALIIIFFFIGSFPWWQAGFQSGSSLQISEMFGSAVSIEKDPWIVRTGNHLFNFLFLGLPAIFGLRPPWEIRWLGLPLLPFILVIWGGVFWFFGKLLKTMEAGERQKWYLILASVGFLAAGFIFTAFGLDPSGRYFLPLAVPFSLIFAQTVVSLPVKKTIQFALAAILVVYAGVGTIQSALKNPPGITTQFDSVTWINHQYDEKLIEFLKDKGEVFGYSNYWVTYPLAYKSREEILYSPSLPYHNDLRYTSRDNRLPEYTRQVERASRTAYITTFNPPLDMALKTGFSRLGVNWREETIGDYHIYFDLSRPVHPSELIGELTPIPSSQ